MTHHQTDTEHFATLDTTIPNNEDYDLALAYAPRIRFDAAEPFLPSVVGYTIFRESAESLSFPRRIEVQTNVACVIEYAIWWDWDIEHLYELEHIWVYVDKSGKVVGSDASWHGGFHPMYNEYGKLPLEEGRIVVYSEPGKHAFAPSAEWLVQRKSNTSACCGVHAGKLGVHITPLFKEIIHERTPLNNRLVHTYLEGHQFVPTYEFTQLFALEDAAFVTWDNLRAWIPKRISWWAKELAFTIAPHERRGLRIAHRGASAYAQEGSVQSIKKAAELGADMVEVDIRSTQDDMPVVSHDASLKRLYGIDRNINNIALSELQRLTQNNPLPTFEEIATLCHELRMGLYLDLKDLSWQAFESIFESVDQHYLLKSTIFASFRADYLAEIKHHLPEATTSILFNSVHVDPVLLAKAIQADYVHPCWENRAKEPHKLLTKEWIASVRSANLGIVCWHEERPAQIAALWSLGVDAICSDTPERLVIRK